MDHHPPGFNPNAWLSNALQAPHGHPNYPVPGLSNNLSPEPQAMEVFHHGLRRRLQPPPELVSPSSLGPSSRECAICQIRYGTVSDPDSLDFEYPIKLSCGHVFGHQCMEEWLQSSVLCPLCRGALGTDTGITSGESEREHAAREEWRRAENEIERNRRSRMGVVDDLERRVQEMQLSPAVGVSRRLAWADRTRWSHVLQEQEARETDIMEAGPSGEWQIPNDELVARQEERIERVRQVREDARIAREQEAREREVQAVEDERVARLLQEDLAREEMQRWRWG